MHELTALVGEAQNLVSYHLAKLRVPGLVSARRSSADGRDTYYAADLARIETVLAGAVGALHPGLRPAAPPPASPAGRRRRRRVSVLFLCTGNSARSQMAEALVRARAGDAVEVASAGSRPKPLHANAVRVMAEAFGIDLAGHEPKHLDRLARRRFDWVITLCDRVREVCPEFPGEPEAIHWSIADPAAGATDDDACYPAFQATAAELDTRIGFLLPVLLDR